MKRFFLIGLALLVAACAHKPAPAPQLVPVPTPCVTKTPTAPIYPTVKPDAGLYERVKTLLAERELRIAYEGEMEAAISACD